MSAQKQYMEEHIIFFAHTLVDFGINTTFVDIHNLDEVENAITENTKCIYFETLGNPNSDVAI